MFAARASQWRYEWTGGGIERKSACAAQVVAAHVGERGVFAASSMAESI
jgi:hypothetical protein